MTGADHGYCSRAFRDTFTNLFLSLNFACWFQLFRLIFICAAYMPCDMRANFKRPPVLLRDVCMVTMVRLILLIIDNSHPTSLERR